MRYNALDIEETRHKRRSLNAKLIPNRLIELAKTGTYFDSAVIN